MCIPNIFSLSGVTVGGGVAVVVVVDISFSEQNNHRRQLESVVAAEIAPHPSQSKMSAPWGGNGESIFEFTGHCDGTFVNGHCDGGTVCRTLLMASFDQLLAYFWRSQQFNEDDLLTFEGVQEAMLRTLMIIMSPCIHASFTHFAHMMYGNANGQGLNLTMPPDEVFDSLIHLCDQLFPH